MRPSRPLMHLLLALAVLLCGLHIGEPAHAEDGAGAHALSHALSETGHADDEDRGTADDTAHHHCPVAPDDSAAASHIVCPPASAHCAGPIPELLSVSRAPPIEPPTT